MTAPSLHFTQNVNVASAAASEDYVQKMFAGGAGFVKHKESGSLFDRTSGVSPKRRAGSHSDLHPPEHLPVCVLLAVGELWVVWGFGVSRTPARAPRCHLPHPTPPTPPRAVTPRDPCATRSCPPTSRLKKTFKERTTPPTSLPPAAQLLLLQRVKQPPPPPPPPRPCLTHHRRQGTRARQSAQSRRIVCEGQPTQH